MLSVYLIFILEGKIQLADKDNDNQDYDVNY